VSAGADGYEVATYPTPVTVTQPNQTTGINFNLLDEISPVTLSGYIFQEDGVTVIPDSSVFVMDENFDAVAGPVESLNGYYELSLLPGNYYLFASASGYGAEFYPNGYNKPAAELVAVPAGVGAEGINFTLSPEATISGYVFMEDGVTPISGAQVVVVAKDFDSVVTYPAITASDGSYTARSLATGDYIAFANADGYIGNSYPTVIHVTQPNAITGINFSLTAESSEVHITGHVYQGDGSTPINEAWVTLYDQNFDSVTAMATDSNGLYDFQVLPGQYYVEVSAIGYGSLYYPNSYDRTGAVPITAEAETGASGINITLSPEAKISGFVYESDGITPISSANICIKAPSDNISYCYESGEDGSYTIYGLSSGSHIIKSYADGYLTEYYFEATSTYAATEVTVTQPNETTGINFTLDRGAILSGHVYQADGVTPIEGAGVYAHGDSDYGFGRSDNEGYYEILLTPGLYFVKTSADGYGSVYYPNANAEAGATQVNVEAGTGASGIDFSLSPEATVSGFIFESDGVTPISGASIGVVLPPGGVAFTRTTSGPDGSYIIHGLASGTYYVTAQKVGYSMESLHIQAIQPNAITGLNFSLDRGAILSGHVYQEDGTTPLEGARVSASGESDDNSSWTDSEGYYEILLKPGLYYVNTSADGYGSVYYPNSNAQAGATQVNVIAETGASGIDFTLSPEAKISGYVYEIDGITPIAGARVSIGPVGGGIWLGKATNTEGWYQFDGLCSGDYILYSSVEGIDGEYYQDKSTLEEATPVTLTQPFETTGINFVLGEQSYSISGSITLPDGVTPLAGVTVRYDSTHSALTDANGEFLLAEVLPGTYTLTPSLAGYVFDPASITVEIIDSDSIGSLFTAYAIPSAIAKTSPATASINKELEVTLSWGVAANAESYEYCIDTTNDNACSSWTDVGPDTSVVVSGLTYQTKYYWQVRAWNGIAGPVYANGAATSYWNFTTKKLLVTEAPVNVSASDGTYPDKVEITWDAVFGATSYKIFRAATPTGTQTLLGSTTALLYNNVPPAGIKYYYFVQGCNANGCGPKSVYDLGWRTAATITARPVLTLPVNGAFLADREVSFAWEFVPGATGYEIQVDTNTYFAAPLSATGTTTEEIYNYIATMPADGKFYWRVRGLGEGGLVGPWSAAWAFTVDTINPLVPNLYLPIANGVTYDTTPALSVTAVTGAKYYRFQVAETDTFGSILFDSTVTTTAVSSTALPYKSGYYWRAKAIDAAGNESDWSAARFLTITPQKTPLTAAYTTDTTPTFTWYAVSGASAYELVVTPKDELQEPYTKLLGIVYSNTPVTALPVGKYEWVIKAKVGDNWVESPVRSLTITPPLLKAPVLVSPAPGAATNDDMPTLEWSPVVDAAAYEIWIDNGTAFTSREYAEVVDGSLTDHEMLTSLPADGRYYWKMRTINSLDVPGPWSAYRALVFDTLAPAVPKLYTPANNATVKGTPSFTWLAVTGGKYYQFQVTTSDDPDFAAPVHLSADTIAVTSYKPPLLDPDVYLWRVRARDLAGNWSGWSAARLVTIIPSVPVAPVLDSPDTGTVSVIDTPTFTWKTVDYGVKYHIQLSKSLYFTTIDHQATIPSTEYTVTPLTPGTYYWRVKAANELDQWGAWSAKRKIVIQP